MNTSARYNTVEGITEQLGDLNGLHRVIRERREAGYDRKERLREFVVLGRWMFDTCGNCGLIDLRDGSEKNEPVAPGDLVWFKGKKVLPLTELQGVFLPESECCPGFRISWHPEQPVKSSDECSLCEKGWKLETCHDFAMSSRPEYSAEGVIEKPPRYMHRLCYRAQRANDARERFDVIFSKAGFTQISLAEIPNQYCPCIICEPWYRARTEVGTITIGWRKRVINIDWSRATRADLRPLFANEPVTKEAGLIHAYGEAKAEEYLRRVREELGQPAHRRQVAEPRP